MLQGITIQLEGQYLMIAMPGSSRYTGLQALFVLDKDEVRGPENVIYSRQTTTTPPESSRAQPAGVSYTDAVEHL